jgi:hypothetical protein
MESALDALFEVLSFGGIIVLVVLGLGIIARLHHRLAVALRQTRAIYPLILVLSMR